MAGKLKERGEGSRRLGVLGGTFDPVHLAHLVIAEEARFQFGLEKVLFIPAAKSPHKKERQDSPTSRRYRMVELAIEDNRHVEASPIEIERGGISYTIDTLHELHEIYGPETEIFFITGTDAIREIQAWKDPLEVLRESRFIVATRPGYPFERWEEVLPKGEVNGEPVINRVHLMEIPELGISATDIRRRVSAGMPYRYMVPEAVWKYIKENGLYREGHRGPNT